MSAIRGNAVSGLGPATPAAPRMTARSGGFSVPADGVARPGAPAATTEVSLGGLLALQEAGGDDVRDREARKRGRDLLEELAALQRDLLGHGPDGARLARLVALADAAPEAADPDLRAIVQAIALRAKVEAAKRSAMPA